MRRLLIWPIGLTLVSVFLMVRVPAANVGFQNNFLLWNLFLAVVPLVPAFCFRVFSVPWHWLFFPAWLLFLPNSFYILTDLGHILNLYQYDATIGRQFLDLNGPQIRSLFSWQGLKFLTLAGAGWGYGILSLVLVWQKLSLPHPLLTLCELTVCFLAGLGVALGRFYRWNTWDAWRNFTEIKIDLRELFTTETGLGTTLVFMVLIFFTFKLSQQVRSF